MSLSRDLTCLLALVLFVLASILNMVEIVAQNRWWQENRAAWYAMNPVVFKDRATHHTNHLRTAAGFVNAIGWFVFLFPLSRLSTVLSRGGKRRGAVGVHLWMVVLGFGAFLAEIVCRLLTTGMENVVDWIRQDFNLKDWGASTSGADDLGWKAMELLIMLNHGIVMWVETFEWLAMGGIMFLVLVSIVTETVPVFPRGFGYLSGLIALASVLTFAAGVFRLEAHHVYANLQLALLVVNTFFFYPWWFTSLSVRLPQAVADLMAANIGESTRKEEEVVVPS